MPEWSVCGGRLLSDRAKLSQITRNRDTRARLVNAPSNVVKHNVSGHFCLRDAPWPQGAHGSLQASPRYLQMPPDASQMPPDASQMLPRCLSDVPSPPRCLQKDVSQRAPKNCLGSYAGVIQGFLSTQGVMPKSDPCKQNRFSINFARQFG